MCCVVSELAEECYVGFADISTGGAYDHWYDDQVVGYVIYYFYCLLMASVGSHCKDSRDLLPKVIK